MATIHYEALDGWWKSAGFWGVLGTAIAVGVGLPLPWAAGSILAGAAVGAALAFLLWKMKPRALARADWILPLALTVAVYFAVDAGHGPRTPTIGFLALGSLFHAAKQLAFGLLGARAMKAVNEKNACWLSKLEPPVKRTGPPTAPFGGDSAREAFLAALPAAMQDEFRRAVTDVIEAVPFRSLESLPPVISALGGSPLLPPGTPWPERDGNPMDFLVQLNLADLPAPSGTLPTAGLLAIFYDTDGRPWGRAAEDLGSTVVLHTPDPAVAVVARSPGESGSLPLRQPLAFRHASALALTDFQKSQFYRLVREASGLEKQRLSDLHDAMLESGPHALRVMSPPALIHGDMEDELTVATSAHGLPPGTPWTLLIQLDSNDDLDWHWADAGSLYFWLPADDLAAGRFDRVWTVLQH
jgi:hypothetical protein